jgi:hypothetical protein
VNCVDNYTALSVKVARVNHYAAPKDEDRDRCSPEEEFLALARKSHPITLRRKPWPDDQSSVRSDLSNFPADHRDRGHSSYDRGSGDGPDRRSAPRSLGPGHVDSGPAAALSQRCVKSHPRNSFDLRRQSRPFLHGF